MKTLGKVLLSVEVGDWFVTLSRDSDSDCVQFVATGGGVRRSEWFSSYSVALVRVACFVRIVESNETQGFTRAARGFERQADQFFLQAVTQ